MLSKKGMMRAEVQCIKVRLRPGTTERAVSFIKSLKTTRVEENRAAGIEAGIDIESIFLEQTPEADFLYFYVRAEHLPQRRPGATPPTNPLLLEKGQLSQQTWEDVKPLQILLDFDSHASDRQKGSE
jgi:hypothetical protein